MMSKIAVGLVCVALIFALGCASLKSTDNFGGLDLTPEGNDNVAHYNARNWGIYLLWIPLITGDTDRPNQLFAMSFFTDNVNLDAMAEMIADEAAANGASVLEDVGSARGGFPVIFPPILFYKSVGMTANAVD